MVEVYCKIRGEDGKWAATRLDDEKIEKRCGRKRENFVETEETLETVLFTDRDLLEGSISLGELVINTPGDEGDTWKKSKWKLNFNDSAESPRQN